MVELTIFNALLIAAIVIVLVILKKSVASETWKNIILLIAPLLTIACHYSSLLYHFWQEGNALSFLSSNPNLILPIYPCNVVMWCCLIFGLCKNKATPFTKFLADYIFWFGLFSAVIGMFLNIDFIRNPTFADFDVTKGIVAHAFMLLNVLLLPVFGYIKIDLSKNFRHILISMVMMFVIGCYCNLVFEVLVSKEIALFVNSMFIFTSPFEGLPFIRYPFICLVAGVFYFIIFAICEWFAYPKGQRWISRCFHKQNIE